MKAVGFTANLPSSDPAALLDLDLPEPGLPVGHDLLVRVRAVSVNPRDAKSRLGLPSSPEKPVVAGYDASGVVEAVGPDTVLFRPGDEGFGLGLSIVRAIAEAHHGRVELDPGHSPGARFVIILPIDPEAPWPAS